MDVRFTTDPVSVSRMTTEELRKLYLIDSLFVPDTTPMVYSDIDRSITGSAVPVAGPLKLLSSKKEMAADHFAERREIGIINIGGDGTVTADGTAHAMKYKDALYVGRGTKDIHFASANSSTPARFYFVSYPAHEKFPTVRAALADAAKVKLGSKSDANERTINKYIHPDGIKSAQLVMGLTELEEGSVWNTMPPHTHQRRSEIYMYFNLPESALVVHMMGRPDDTRHLIMRNGQAVLSPSWSIHTGVGTRNYSFIWAMGGENQVFDDMDGVDMKHMA